MLTQVPPQLWSKHDTDIGLIKSAQPVEILLKPVCAPPKIQQYPMKPEAEQDIEKSTERLLKAEVLILTHSETNAPIFPVLKADKSKYLLVHDLRAVN